MTSKAADVEVRDVLGVPVNALNMDQTLDHIHGCITRRERLLIGVVNAAKVVKMASDPDLDEAVRTSDIILADGMSVVWASRILRQSLPERVPGIDLMFKLLQRGSEHGYRVYCLGATEEVSQEVARRLQEDYPGVVLAGRRNGYFSDDERQAVADDIAAARPDILFVAMTSPRKEVFLGDFAEHMDVPVCHGVGGSFDVYAGKVKRAPERWQRWGMEWLYRVIQEPRRMWRRYLVTNTLFGGMVLKDLLTGGSRRRARARHNAAPQRGETASAATEHQTTSV